MSVTDLADDGAGPWFNRALQWVPRILSSKPHIVWLVALGIYLIVLPLLGIAVSAKTELIAATTRTSPATSERVSLPAARCIWSVRAVSGRGSMPKG